MRTNITALRQIGPVAEGWSNKYALSARGSNHLIVSLEAMMLRYAQNASCWKIMIEELFFCASYQQEEHGTAQIRMKAKGTLLRWVTSGLTHTVERTGDVFWPQWRSSASFGPSKGCLSPCKKATHTNKWRGKTSAIFDGCEYTVIESPLMEP